jgi:hypothetical protein
MQCIINVALGNKYVQQQKRLGESLEENFDGDFLTWDKFPNHNYDEKNPYNVKAAAFEEAIKKGYKQILWLDAPVLALKNVKPIFDSIEKHGYLTLKNHNYNLAQTCNDKSLEYFNITRDEAEKVEEHASGVIGIDMTNPKGKKLIEMFIKACRNDVSNGSREHDGQSTDPRFMFHRQDQSVLSLCAHALKLPPIQKWNNGPIVLHRKHITEKTILAWSNRGKGKTLRIKHQSRNKTEKNKRGFIYLKCRAGLNDNLCQLATCMDYAIQHRRSIILEMPTYNAANISKVFDFSNFPVPVYTNAAEMLKKLSNSPVEPSYMKSVTNRIDFSDRNEETGVWHDKQGRPVSFDLTKSYPSNKILIFAGGGGGSTSINALEHMRFKREFIKEYKETLIKHNIPEKYVSIHLRATDRKLQVNDNMGHGDSLIMIDDFIKKHYKENVFVAGDNPKLIEKLTKKYPTIIKTEATKVSSCKSEHSCKALHKSGKTDPNNLKQAIIDLLILAGGSAILTTQGGFSRLAKHLQERPHVLKRLIGGSG